MMFATQIQSETTSLLVLLSTSVRLHTSDPLNPHLDESQLIAVEL